MNGISRLAALSVGGESRFRQLALQGLTIHSDSKVLDLCCRLRSNHAIFSQAIQKRHRIGCFPIIDKTSATECTLSRICGSFR